MKKVTKLEHYIKFAKISKSRVDELNQWIGEHGRYFEKGRPLGKTKATIKLRDLNILINIKAMETVKMIENGYN